MNLIFFQNCISPHQVPYIRECAKDKRIEHVYLIVPRTDYEQRKDMGWNSSKLLVNTAITCYVMPSDKLVLTLLQNTSNSFCFFSGIRADANVYYWFKMSLTYDVKRFIITEPPLTYKKPLWMHYLRFYLQDYKYVKHIDGIFGFGQAAVDYYRSISNHWKVFPFQYVTESIQRTSFQTSSSGRLKLLFVGSLSHRKNVRVVLDALNNLSDIEFTIVGDGEEKTALKELVVQKKLPVTFCGKKQMNEIPHIMENHDILILPSLHDGWGAVVNEAITMGLYIITSDKCGAKALIKNKRIGIVFKNNDATDLHVKLHNCLINKETIRNDLNARLEYSETIQGPTVAKYFINCLNQVKNRQ